MSKKHNWHSFNIYKDKKLETSATFSRSHLLMDLKISQVGVFFSYSKTESWPLRRTLTQTWLNWRLQGRLNIYLEVTVFVFRDMLPQIIDSGRFVNAYSTIHISVYSHGHLLKTSCSTRSDPLHRCLQPVVARPWLFSPGLHRQCLGFFPSAAALGLLQPQSLLASLCSSFLVDSCYVVACFSSHTTMGRIPYVSPELQKHIHIYLQVYKYINMAIIEK